MYILYIYDKYVCLYVCIYIYIYIYIIYIYIYICINPNIFRYPRPYFALEKCLLKVLRFFQIFQYFPKVLRLFVGRFVKCYIALELQL